jgi:uncharacterized paraquat-inducible protein A
MDEPQIQTREICHRCLEPVPAKLSRCPNCGERVHQAGRVRKSLAIFGLAMFLLIAAVAYRMMQTSGAPSVDDNSSAPHRAGDPDTPPPPPPKPALGQ